MKKAQVSRRNFLKGAGAGALGLSIFGLNTGAALAQVSSTPGGEVGAVYRFMLGRMEAMVIIDAGLTQNTGLFGNDEVSAEEVLAFFQNLNLTEDGEFKALAQVLVLNADDGLVLFDTGSGAANPAGGKLLPTLESMDFSADDVSAVIMSHLHPDHISGLSNAGVLTYPNAQVYFPQPEYDFMTGDVPSAAQGMVRGAMGRLQPAIDADRVTFFNDGDELVPGVTAMAAHGHTPGHMAFLIESGDSRLLNIVDTAINAYAGLMHPEWYVRFDSIPEMAVKTRKSLLAMSSDERVQIFGYHLPFPGIGYAVRRGDASWQWVATAV